MSVCLTKFVDSTSSILISFPLPPHLLLCPHLLLISSLCHLHIPVITSSSLSSSSSPHIFLMTSSFTCDYLLISLKSLLYLLFICSSSVPHIFLLFPYIIHVSSLHPLYLLIFSSLSPLHFLLILTYFLLPSYTFPLHI